MVSASTTSAFYSNRRSYLEVFSGVNTAYTQRRRITLIACVYVREAAGVLLPRGVTVW